MTVASQVKQTLATLKGSQATLRIYSEQIRNNESAAVFHDALDKTRDIVNDLEKRAQALELQEPQYRGN